MANIYGYRRDLHEPDPRKAVTIPEDCANYGWEPHDSRWDETDIIQKISSTDDVDDKCVIYYHAQEAHSNETGYTEVRLSLEPFDGAISIFYCPKYPWRSIADIAIMNIFGVMLSGTLDWKQSLLSSDWKRINCNFVKGDDSDAN